MPRSGSLTRLTNYFNQAASATSSSSNQQTNGAPRRSVTGTIDQHQRNHNQNHQAQTLARASRSETSMKPRSSSTNTQRRATTALNSPSDDDGDNDDAQRIFEQAMKPLNADELYCGQGSVRNLVYSYEVFPLKERCDSDHKIRQLREEREREMQTVIEAKTATQAVTVAVSNQAAQQQQLMMIEEQQQQQQQQLQQLIHQQQLQQQQQAHMRKELSTISERTEHSVSPHLNLLG